MKCGCICFHENVRRMVTPGPAIMIRTSGIGRASHPHHEHKFDAVLDRMAHLRSNFSARSKRHYNFAGECQYTPRLQMAEPNNNL